MKKTQTMAFANLMTALVFIAIGIYAVVASYGFRTVNNTAVQPATFPRVMAWAMIVCAAVVLVMNAVKLGRDTEKAPILSLKDRGIRGALICCVIAFAYYLLWEPVGFFILAPITLFALMYLIDMRNYVTMAIVAVVLPLIMWLLFYKVLSISVPLGPLDFLYDFI